MMLGYADNWFVNVQASIKLGCQTAERNAWFGSNLNNLHVLDIRYELVVDAQRSFERCFV